MRLDSRPFRTKLNMHWPENMMRGKNTSHGWRDINNKSIKENEREKLCAHLGPLVRM